MKLDPYNWTTGRLRRVYLAAVILWLNLSRHTLDEVEQLHDIARGDL